MATDKNSRFDGQRNMDISLPEIDLGADGNRWVWDGLRWKIKVDPKLISKRLSFTGEGDNADWKWIERPIALIDNQNSIYTGGNACPLDVSNMEGMDDDVTHAVCGENINVMKNYIAPKISNFSGADGATTKDTNTAAAPAKPERGKVVLDSIEKGLGAASTLFVKKQEGKAMEAKLAKEEKSGASATDSITILGMHPITFGIVALLSLGVIGVIGYKKLYKKS